MGAIEGNFNNKQLINILVDQRYRLLRHGILLTVFLWMLLFNTHITQQYIGNYSYYYVISIYLIFNAMFYINMYVLLPTLFFRAKYALYLFVLVLMVVAGLNSLGYISNLLLPYRIFETPKIVDRVDDVNWTIIIVALILVTTTIKLFQRWMKDNERIDQLKNLTLSMELNELKNQINPHFLFNMLNNVNVLIKSNPDKASTVIFKLSEFLRYQLYENTSEKTILVSEIHFLSNFLNLEKIRRDDFEFTIQANETDLKGIQVPPNLFTTFIENAVKHSVDFSGKQSFIQNQIKAENHKLFFKCTNSKCVEAIAYTSKNSGLGMVNIKRRLELLFEDKYQLDIISSPDLYTVKLNFPL